MRTLLRYIDDKTTEYEKLPLFEFLRDDSVDARARLGFVPCLAHFVMTFADLYALVLRDEPARDDYQKLVNAHTYEDGGHWKWFLSDLAVLEMDEPARFSEALRFIWGDATVKTRMLAYEMCRLGLGASSLHKLVLVHCIEAAGKVSLTAGAPVGRAVAQRLGRKLVYFGPHHLDTESDHTLEDDSVRRSLDEVVIDDTARAELKILVDRAFAAFVAFSDELLRFAQQHPTRSVT
jgi:hypothetical protein